MILGTAVWISILEGDSRLAAFMLHFFVSRRNRSMLSTNIVLFKVRIAIAIQFLVDIRCIHAMEPAESALAKSTGSQEENDIARQDAALFHVLSSKKKISKSEAEYTEVKIEKAKERCSNCKFNLGDEMSCHIVEGEINNENGISKFFSAKGDGMLPGDIVWDFIKKKGRKLDYDEGYVIDQGAEGFQCKDCKYYMYSHSCLLIKGTFRPEMSCGFIVKIGNGTDIQSLSTSLSRINYNLVWLTY